MVGLLINHKQINHDDRAFHNNSVYQHGGSTTICAAALGLPNLATIDTLVVTHLSYILKGVCTVVYIVSFCA